jgi:hypothetical protein
LCRTETILPLTPGHVDDRARLTLDYLEDYQFFQALFADLYCEGQVFGLEEIVRSLREHPELRQINEHLDAKYRERSRALVRLQFHSGGQLCDVRL